MTPFENPPIVSLGRTVRGLPETAITNAYRTGRADAFVEMDAMTATAIAELDTVAVRCAIGRDTAEGIIRIWTDMRARLAALKLGDGA